jgi:hypothetical protein
MNNKGQSLGISIIVAITLFLVGMISLNFIRDEITNVRLPENLDCSNASGISDGTKLTCLTVDIALPYLILLIISVTGGVITNRLLS